MGLRPGSRELARETRGNKRRGSTQIAYYDRSWLLQAINMAMQLKGVDTFHGVSGWSFPGASWFVNIFCRMFRSVL